MTETTTTPFTEKTYNSLMEFKDCFESKSENTKTQINTKGVENEEFFKNVGGNFKGMRY